MESKSFENIIQKTLISGGLGGWFGAIYGANIAAIDPHRPRNPFHTALYRGFPNLSNRGAVA